METVDITKENIEKIGYLFPSCVVETIDENGKTKRVINFDILRQLLSESFCQGGAWIFFILLTHILSLLLPE